MFECILLGYLRFRADCFFHCPVNYWFKYYRSSSISGRIYYNSSRIETMPLVFTRLGISCLTIIDMIPMLFPLFSEAESSHGGPPDRPVESIHSSQVCRGAHLGLHVRGGYRSNTRPAETHRHSLGLGKPRTARAEAAIGRSRDDPVNSQG